MAERYFFPNSRLSRLNHNANDYTGVLRTISASMAHTHCTDKLMLKIDKNEEIELFTLCNPKLELNHYKYNETMVWHYLSGIRRMSAYTLYFYYLTITEKNGEWHMKEHGPVRVSEVPPCDNLKEVIYALADYTKYPENRRIKEELVSI